MDIVNKKITYLTAGLLLACFLGFFKTYFGRFPSFAGTSFIVHYHVFTLFLWFGLLIAQPILIRRGKTEIHSTLGKASYFLIPFILLGFVMIINEGQIRHKEPELLLASLFDAGLFIFFYVMGQLTRKNTPYHARYMMLTLLAFVNPSVGRLISPMVSLPFLLIIILILITIEFFTRKIYKPYLMALGAYFILLGIIIYFMTAQKELLEKLWMMIWG